MKKNTLVWCKTKKEVLATLKVAEENGYRFSTDFADRAWECYDNKTVINLNGDSHIVTYCYKEWYEKRYSEKIISAEKFLDIKPILITKKGRLTIAEDKNTGEKGIASCSPDDTYDFHTGALIAVARLVAKDSGISGDAETVLRGLIGDKPVDDAPNAPKFKVGDLVTLKYGLEPGEVYGDMHIYKGKMFDSIYGKPQEVVDVSKGETRSSIYETKSGFYYPEEMLEKWDESKIREGDMVRVKDGCTKDRCDTYYKWLKDNIHDVDLLLGYERRESVSTADVYTVVKIAPHGHFTDLWLAFIKRTDGFGNTYSYLFDINALEKVTE